MVDQPAEREHFALDFKDAAIPRFGHSDGVFDLFIETRFTINHPFIQFFKTPLAFWQSLDQNNLTSRHKVAQIPFIKVVARAYYGAYFNAYGFKYLATNFVSGRPAAALYDFCSVECGTFYRPCGLQLTARLSNYQCKGPFTRSDFKDPILGSENWKQVFRRSDFKVSFFAVRMSDSQLYFQNKQRIFNLAPKRSQGYHANLSAPFIFQKECRMKVEHALFPSVFFFKITDPCVEKSFSMCSHDLIFETNKNQILKNGSCELALILLNYRMYLT